MRADRKSGKVKGSKMNSKAVTTVNRCMGLLTVGWLARREER